MASQRMNVALALCVVTMIWTAANAQSSTDCTQVFISMSPCLNYIQANSSSTPSSACCTQLGSVVHSEPQCLCQILNGGGSALGISINQTQALALPKACNVQTPPTSKCNVASPALSPANAPGSSAVPSGRGSSTVPSTDNGSSDATSTKLASPLVFFLLFVASYASAF